MATKPKKASKAKPGGKAADLEIKSKILDRIVRELSARVTPARDYETWDSGAFGKYIRK